MHKMRWLRRYRTWLIAILVAVIFMQAVSWEILSDAAIHISKPQSVELKSNAISLVTPFSYGHAYGIAAGSSLAQLTDSQLAARLYGIKSAGASWVRFDFDWNQIQPSSSQSYNWTGYDRLVKYATARNLHVLGIIDYTPLWARTSDCNYSNKCPPANPNQYAAFAAALASRYSSMGLHVWEVWNEPNNPNFWQPAANPVKYTALLEVAYNAIHKADEQSYVLSGGLSPQSTDGKAYSPYDFLSDVYADDGQGYFDGVADHPYTFPLTPANNVDDGWTQMAASSHSLRSLMVSAGDGTKKIWITEFGSPTGGPGPVATLDNPNLSAEPYVVDDALQAKILSDAVSLYSSYQWAGPFLYYSYQDAGTDPTTNENFFGLLTADGTQKPAYAVFSQAASSNL